MKMKHQRRNKRGSAGCPYLAQCTQIGREKMAMKVGLTFACLNMKKLARLLCKAGPDTLNKTTIFAILKGKIEKMKSRQRKQVFSQTGKGFIFIIAANGSDCIRNHICRIILSISEACASAAGKAEIVS